jgi:hypothetical protein
MNAGMNGAPRRLGGTMKTLLAVLARLADLVTAFRPVAVPVPVRARERARK